MPRVQNLQKKNYEKFLRRGKPTLTPWLLNVVLSEADSKVRDHAAEGLYDLGDRRCVTPLLKAASNDPDVPYHVLLTLARFTDDERIQEVWELAARHKNKHFREELARSCAYAGLPSPLGDVVYGSLVVDKTQARPVVEDSDFSTILARCQTSTLYEDAQHAESWLERMLKTSGRELSDDNLHAVIDLKPYTEWRYTGGKYGDAKPRPIKVSFQSAKRMAGFELLHRWTLLPYWQRPWFIRWLYAAIGAKPRRPPFTHLWGYQRSLNANLGDTGEPGKAEWSAF